MESLFPFLTSLIAIIVIYYLFLKYSQKRLIKKKAPPQPGGAWPIIGHLPLLAASQPAHILLGNLADKYGPIFTIKLGVHQTLVVSNSNIAKECLTINDRAFANRPKSLTTEILGYDYHMLGFAPYGDYWRQIRKIATIELLSSHRLDVLKHVREGEVKEAIKQLYQKWTKNNNKQLMVEMKSWFWDITLNVILKIIVGKRYVEYGENGNEAKETDQWRNALRDFMELSGKFSVSDALPFLRWLDVGGIEKEMKKTAEKLDSVVDKWLEEHKRNKSLGISKGQEDDFMDLLLSILDDVKEFSNRDADTINKATCLSLISAASDTTVITLTWALSLLLNNRDALRKVQQELDMVVGRERQLTESDIRTLDYFQAIVKETFRLHPPAPLLLPHESMEECIVDGYHIPAGTRLFINVAKMQRDPNVWSNPQEFRPERFLTTHKDVDVKGKHYELLPFSSGRRICPGITFGLQVLNLTLATFLHSFHIETLSDNPLDMSEGVGITNMKVAPVEVLVTPRLPSHLY